MIKSIGIALLFLVSSAFGAVLLQSCHTQSGWESISLKEAVNLAIYLIEEYDPQSEVKKSICLSSSVSLDQCANSMTPETEGFLEKTNIHLSHSQVPSK